MRKLCAILLFVVGSGLAVGADRACPNCPKPAAKAKADCPCGCGCSEGKKCDCGPSCGCPNCPGTKAVSKAPVKRWVKTVEGGKVFYKLAE